METLRGRVYELISQLSYVPRALSFIWTASRSWTLAWLFIVAVEGIVPAVLVYLTRPLIDAIAPVVGVGWSWSVVSPVIFPAALMGGVIVLSEILRSAGNWIRTAQSEFIRDYLAGLVHEKSISVDLGFYESPQFHDRLERARTDLSSRPLVLLESMGNLLQNCITLVAMAMLLASYEPWLPWLLLLSTIPVFYVVLHFGRRYHRWWEESTTDRRLVQYYETLLTHSACAAELRLFNLGAYFRGNFQNLRGRIRGERIRLTRDQSLARLGAGLAGEMISAVAVGWIVWRAIEGRATLGDIALFYQAAQRGQNLFQAVLENVGQIYANTLS